MLNIVGAENDDAAHLAADPVLTSFAQDQIDAHRKDRADKIRPDLHKARQTLEKAETTLASVPVGGQVNLVLRSTFVGNSAVGGQVILEVDVIAKYVERLMHAK